MRIFFQWLKSTNLVSTHSTFHIVVEYEIYSHWKNISSNHLFSNFFSKTVTFTMFTKFLPKKCESKFPQSLCKKNKRAALVSQTKNISWNQFTLFYSTVISLIEAAACNRNHFFDFWCAAFIWERLQLKFWFASITSLNVPFSRKKSTNFT